MKTEMDVNANDELREKGQALIDAAYEFFRVHRKVCGPNAVVWLEGSNGELIVFTRGEYRRQIMMNIEPLRPEEPLQFDGE